MKKVTEYGLTLIELVITIAIAGILAGLAIPSFVEMIRDNRMASHANELVSSLNLARSEAVKRSTSVRITALTPASDNEWGKGWTVWVDLDSDGAIDDAAGDEEVLKVAPAFKGDLTLDSTPDTSEFVYRADGSLGSNQILHLCDSKDTGERGRMITIAPSGSISVGNFTCT